MATFKHNKKRSTGIVYEMLVRRLTKTMVEQDKEGYTKALTIVRKYFSEGCVLSQERELFDVIRNTRGVSESAARRVLGEIQKHALSLDRKKIDIKKSNLIKEINHGFGQEFWAEHRIPDYRLLATIQMVIDTAHEAARLTESVQRIQLEEVLVTHMTSQDEKKAVAPVARPEVDRLVMAMVAKRFTEKYAGSLIPSQKKLLERYIRFQVTGDEKVVKDYLLAEGQRTFQAIDKAASIPEVKSDDVMVTRLQEARTRLSEVMTEVSAYGKIEGPVEEMFLFQKLVEEIESDE